MKNEDKENIEYKHFELGQNPQWVLGGGKLLHAQFGAAVGHDGFIYSVGCNQYRLSPDTGILKQLPVPASLIRESNYAPYQSHLLALTKSKVFIYVTVSLNAPNLMLSYDLGTGKLDEGYEDISGKWSAGVVLYDDRYLFTFRIPSCLIVCCFGPNSYSILLLLVPLLWILTSMSVHCQMDSLFLMRGLTYSLIAQQECKLNYMHSYLITWI
ncbi:hypothetical protein ACLB2K_005007 [Fragaria x ananassa]